MRRVVALTVLLVPSLAHADRRAYGTTYEAVLAPKGELDVELWSTYARLGEIDGGPASRGLRQMVELEYGITDRWDAALYNMVDLTSTDESDSGYAGFKIETRFRPSFPGEWFVDPVFYFEFQDLFRGDANQTYELKLILAKNIGPVNVSFNISGEEERTTDATWNLEIEHAEGVSYELSPRWKVGLETFGTEEKPDRPDARLVGHRRCGRAACRRRRCRRVLRAIDRRVAILESRAERQPTFTVRHVRRDVDVVQPVTLDDG